MAQTPTPPRDTSPLSPIKDPELRNAIMDAVSNYKISESNAQDELNELSSHTEVEAIEANNEGIFISGSNNFEANATIYVVLHYGDKKEPFSTTDTFPVHVTGTFDANKKSVKIRNFIVDTTAFFDGDDEAEALRKT